jgi:pimeloyl-ACP methyl ester carboxylesterase
VLADVYNTVHSGRFVGDTIAAMDWMERDVGVRRFVGSGLCGGAITALLAAEADARIECLLALGLPSVLEGGPENWARVLTHQEAVGLRGSYFQKLADPASLRRFLTGKSSYKVIWRVVRAWIDERGASQGDEPAPRRAATDQTNPRFANAFLTVLRSRRPMLLIFAGADRLRAQFEEHFEAHNETRLRELRQFYEVQVVANANHVFAEPASVAGLLDTSAHWLVQRYSTPQDLHGRSLSE